ncbi:hypothetical protein TWF481_012262 [Arthrobotrys musiformis]|uniref:Uncharacterized protein n=1 Tax=Arthrobotrys musiformis TaxID=47236 RepID=A0AAV9VWH8_9PEZI
MGDIVMENIDGVMGASDQPPIASLTTECQHLFQEVLANIQQSSEFDTFETQFGRLNIWASNIGALASGNSSLDYRLRLSEDIKSMVLRLLEVLKGSLHQAIDEGRDSASRSQVFTEAIEAASESLDRLQNLAVVIKKSSARSRNLRSKALTDDDEINFKGFILRVLKHRFKEANGTLCEQVAESIALRRKQFDYKMRHQEKLAHNTCRNDSSPSSNLHPRPSEPLIAGTKHRLVVPQMRSGQIDIDTREPKRLRLLPLSSSPYAIALSETNASTLDTKMFRKIFPTHKPARSIVSQGTSIRDLKLEYPPPPFLALEQRECSCPYCCELIRSAHATNEKWWKHHVDEDLEPYSCISEKCRSSPAQFTKFQDWVQHMSTHGAPNMAWGVHLQMLHCPICESLEPFRWKEDFLDHMDSLHAAKFTQTQLLTLSRRSTVAIVREPHICPFCNCMPEEIMKITPQNRDKIMELLPRHIAGHLRSLAFMALPYREDINDFQSEGSRDRSEEDSSTRSRRISELGFEWPEQWVETDVAMKTIEREEREDEGGVPFTQLSPLQWDFLPSKEYDIQEDRVIQKFVTAKRNLVGLASEFMEDLLPPGLVPSLTQGGPVPPKMEPRPELALDTSSESKRPIPLNIKHEF